MNTRPTVFFFCALHCEAKPIIAHYQLKKVPTAHPFELYRGEGVILTLSGVGTHNMAAAVAYTLALFPTPFPVLLNVGIAGHRQHPLGQFVIADRICSDAPSSQCFYPQWINLPPTLSSSLVTVAEPVTHYPDNNLYDMEAAAFYPIALKFSTVELSQCLKVVSDNAQHTTFEINAKKVTEWLAQHIDTLSIIADTLGQQRQMLVNQQHPQLTEILNHYHFSITAKNQLQQQLQRWNILTDGQHIPWKQQNFSTGKQLLHWLGQQEHAFRL